MNQPFRPLPESLAKYATPMFLKGLFRRRLDVDRRLRLPVAWSPDRAQVWLLFAYGLLFDGEEMTGGLYLHPTRAKNLDDIIPRVVHGLIKGTTPAAFLEDLEGKARRRSLPPGLVTAIRINPSSRRFTLTQSQSDWIGCRQGTLIMRGGHSHVHICAPAEWAEFKRKARPISQQRLKSKIRGVQSSRAGQTINHHALRVSELSGEAHTCKNCGVKAPSISNLTAGFCLRHPQGPNKGKHVLYEGAEKSRYPCKHCGNSAASISALVASFCLRHPLGANNGRHEPAL